ncbi:MAG: type IV pilus assembly protein FimV [Bordetella sp.]|uniref:type IV pilus assembly protein FimV n=1 Tax=Bordetella sp. TaxID=28081 RepID=UPI003F7BAA8E
MRPSVRLSRKTVLAWSLAAALGLTAIGTAQAVSLGHARVVSARGAPLQVLVPLIDLTPDEAANLHISLADAAAWQRAGLQPPTPLADMHATLETGTQGKRDVLVTSSQPPGHDAIDVLLDMQSNAGQRQLQVTVLVPADDIVSGIQQAGVGGTRAAAGAAIGQIKVARGQTLWGIASSHAVANATIYQELVALWRANPQAFIQNNMNLVRTGATLKLPDAATVRAIDPAEARRIFDEQAAAFQRYRGRLGAGTQSSSSPVASNHQTSAGGKVESAAAANKVSPPSAQDQLRLSAPSQTDAKADAQTSNQHAMEDASKRIGELQANVQALGQAAGATQQGATGNGQAEQNGQSTSAPPSGAASAPDSSATGSNTSNAAVSNSAGASSAAATGSNGPVTGPSSPTANALDEAKDTAKKVVNKSGMADWLSDNLLIVVTAVLVVIIFIVALLMRRAGRHSDDDDDSYGYAEHSMDDATSDQDVDHRISGINLDLDHHSGKDDEAPRGGRT